MNEYSIRVYADYPGAIAALCVELGDTPEDACRAFLRNYIAPEGATYVTATCGDVAVTADIGPDFGPVAENDWRAPHTTGETA